MQYFDIYIDSMKGIYTYSDKNDEFEIGENVIVPFRNIKKSGFIIRKNLKEIVITALSLLHAQIDITGMLWIAKGLDFVLCVKVYKND